MSIPATQPVGHHPPFVRSAPVPLSPSAWRRVRLMLTAGLFVVATVTGVGVGLQGAAVSPVAPAAATAAGANPAPVPVVGGAHGTATDHRGHR